jgi:hypothetical protein
MTSSEQAVLKTLVYADLFNYPLTRAEIHRYLISPPNTPGVFQANTPGVENLVKQKRISTLQNYYFLPGRQSLISLRQFRQQISQAKLKRAQSLANLLAKIPTIQGIFLTGALAMNNADESDDLDFLIITQTNTLWTTRLFTNLFADVFRLRRRPGQTEPHVSDKICLNLWLDETALSLPKTKRNLYTAHEIAQVKPLVSKNHTHEKFLSANSWINRYLPNVKLPNHKIHLHSSFLIPHSSITEHLTYKLQLAYMKRKMTRESVSPHSAFFHPRPTEKNILNRYNKQIVLLTTK